MAKTEKNAQSREKARFLTDEFRVSYPHVFKPAQVMGKGDPKYSITMLFKKSQDMSRIKIAMKHAKIAAFGPDEDEWPEMESPVVDGDSPKHKDKEGYKGHYAIKAISNQDIKPSVVDENVEPIVNQADFYPGCYARAQVFARVWEYGGKHGLHFILDHVQKTKDGKPLSSKKSAQEVFAPIVSEEDDTEVEDDEEESPRKSRRSRHDDNDDEEETEKGFM